MEHTPGIDHVAIRVRDFDWMCDFLQRVLGAQVTLEQHDAAGHVQQIWIGGIQLQRDPLFEEPEDRICRLNHLGFDPYPQDFDQTLDAVYAEPGITVYNGGSNGRNWFVLPDGLVIELVRHEA